MEGDRVRALHYAVKWVDQHPLTWLKGAFPASYEVDGWALKLNETRLDAVPPGDLADEDEALATLAPLLDAWAATLEVEERLIMVFQYLGADVECQGDGRGRASADFATAADTAHDATVAITRSAPPGPDPSWRDTDEASLARSMCLRPLRNGTRPVVDAAYWLATHLERWADGDQKAVATKLNVSTSYYKRARQWGARSKGRKVSSNSLTLSEQEKSSLQAALEELIRRLHLAESGLPPGDRLDLTDWP
jgi:hypothetical protein